MSEPVSTSDYKQRQGVAWDIIDEALNSYHEFMLDDDYDYRAAFYKIMERMKRRRELYAPPPDGGRPSEGKGGG